MWGRFGRGDRRSDPVERAIGALLVALLVALEAVEQARSALENVRELFGRTRRTRREGRAYGNAVRMGIGVLVLLAIISFALWLLRRRARETAPVTPAPEEGVDAAPPEEKAPGPTNAEDVPPREEPPPGEERPERRGVTPTVPSPREEPPPGEERPGRR